ncbi:MAG TPA: protein kinase [Thermoanaerobaculia bacterium]|jgi:serine/threonine protein kinase/Tol biopolymer transport system component
MTLSAGTKLGPYEITSPLGAGGMGEVYRAKDPRLAREVAVKVLPEEFFEGEERRARFEREARLLAALNHPGIAAIYSFEEIPSSSSSSSRHLLVMELVEGEGLDQRIASGSLSIEESLSFARQMAEALEAAHEKGIIHRDLKPANVRVTHEGRVKLLDFGLAKMFEGEGGPGSSAGVTHSPTLTARATAAGVILGTAAYMSPEQARGKTVDKRTDVWAFGCVLFEMLTGKRAFEGETVTDVLAAVLMKEPDWSALRAPISSKVKELLRRCLQRDVKQRLRDVGDARIALEEETAASASASGRTPFEENAAVPSPTVGRDAPSTSARGSRRSLYFSWAIAAAFAAAAGALALRTRAPQARDASAGLTASLLPPEGWNFDPLGGPPALSPDGTRLAFVLSDGRKSQLCVLSLATGDSTFLPGTETGRNPFWSVDGRTVGFMGQTTGLATVPASGGAVEYLAPSGPGRGGTSSPDGTVLYSPALLSGIFRVTPGKPGRVAATKVDAARGESTHQWPFFLPDGRHFLFIVQRVDTATRRNETELCVQALGSDTRKVLLKSATRAIHVPGHLLYSWNGSLMAQRFDAERLETVGDAFVVAPRVQYLADGGTGLFTASSGGLLVYAAGGTIGNSRLGVYDRAGALVRTVAETGNYWTPRASPDGKIVAAEVIDSVSSNRDIWTFDAAGADPPVRRTFDPGEDWTPVFSPDGRRLAWGAFRKGTWAIFEKSLAGGEEERLIAHSAPPGSVAAPEGGAILGPGSKFLTAWSPDGKSIAFNGSSADSQDDMWILSVADGTARVILRTPAAERDTVFSPDGRWIAYMSGESGRPEVYVSPFPSGGGRWQVSTGGGGGPRWSRDGRELFYISAGGSLMAAPVTAGAAFEKGAPRELFRVAVRRTNIPQYDVFPDGQRFIVNTVVTEKASTPLTLVQNWSSLVKTK